METEQNSKKSLVFLIVVVLLLIWLSILTEKWATLSIQQHQMEWNNYTYASQLYQKSKHLPPITTAEWKNGAVVFLTRKPHRFADQFNMFALSLKNEQVIAWHDSVTCYRDGKIIPATGADEVILVYQYPFPAELQSEKVVLEPVSICRVRIPPH